MALQTPDGRVLRWQGRVLGAICAASQPAALYVWDSFVDSALAQFELVHMRADVSAADTCQDGPVDFRAQLGAALIDLVTATAANASETASPALTKFQVTRASLLHRKIISRAAQVVCVFHTPLWRQPRGVPQAGRVWYAHCRATAG